MILLETTQLIKTYNRRRVVDEVSFVLEQQEIIGLLGRNGAGKTTTFRMILGMVTPDSGAVAFLGQDITQLAMYRRARLGIGYLSQERSDFRRLTVWQNLQAILETRSDIGRSERNRRAERLLAQYGLTRQRNQKADTLSGGERRKLEIARALVTDPQLILLDEPFSGVDPIAVEDLQREVIRLKEEFGKSVLITDHNVAQTLRVCDRALIIEEGRVKFEGTPRQVINDPGVRSAYTGNLFRGDEFDETPSTRVNHVSSATNQAPFGQRPISQSAVQSSVAPPPVSQPPVSQPPVSQSPVSQSPVSQSLPSRVPGPAPVAGPPRPPSASAQPNLAPARPAASAGVPSATPVRPATSVSQPVTASVRPAAVKPVTVPAKQVVAPGTAPEAAPTAVPPKPAVKSARPPGVRPPS